MTEHEQKAQCTSMIQTTACDTRDNLEKSKQVRTQMVTMAGYSSIRTVVEYVLEKNESQLNT